MTSPARTREALGQSIEIKTKILKDEALLAQVQRTVDMSVQSLETGGCLYFCGNGGSAADAQHLAAELSGRFYYDRPPLAAEALHANSSFLTAVANDYSYDDIFSRYVSARVKKGDVLFGFTTSGNSKNVLKAFEAARQLKALTIAFTGESGGKIKSISDICIQIPSTDTPRIQEAHITLGHIVCELIEAKMFPKK